MGQVGISVKKDVMEEGERASRNFSPWTVNREVGFSVVSHDGRVTLNVITGSERKSRLILILLEHLHQYPGVECLN